MWHKRIPRAAVLTAVAYFVAYVAVQAAPGADPVGTSAQAVSNGPLKVFIVSDTEGPTGVAEYWARNLDPDSPAFRRYRELLTGDINAAVEGCFAAGATEVAVKDDGYRDVNVIPDLLDKRARLLASGGRLLEGLDKGFAGVICVGFHAMEGAKDAVLAHTWSSRGHRRYWINGREAGELAAYAIVAGADHNVPIVMVTGCEGLCREARELLGDDLVAVAVKRLRGDKTVELPGPEKTRPMITAAAREAVRRIGQFKPYKAEFPLKMRLRLPTKSAVDTHIRWRRKNKHNWPGRRVNDTTIEATLHGTEHIIL